MQVLSTCSDYALLAIEKYGVVSGGLKALKRIFKCHPFNPEDMTPFRYTKNEYKGSTNGLLSRYNEAVNGFDFGYTNSYGIAIILLTVLIKLILLPFSFMQINSMKKCRK